MTIRALYAPWPEGARRSWGWGALGLLALGYLVSSIATLLVISIHAVMGLVASGVDFATLSATEIETAVAHSTSQALLPGLLAQFAVWFALTLFWVKVFERRSMASLGLEGRGFVGRYLFGLVLGVILVALVGAGVAGLTALFGDLEALSTPGDAAGGPVDYTRALSQAALVGYGLLLALFLFQGGVEEFIFRGWLMSTLTARWGQATGVVVASFIFAVFHLHVFMSGLIFGVLALTGIGLTGLVFSMLALWRRSIVEAIAAHGAFNAVAVIGPTFAMLASDPSLDFNSALMQVFSTATGTQGAQDTQIGVQTAAQPLIMGVISLILLSVVLRARTARGGNEDAA